MQKPSKYTIMIIDDHPIIHDGLRTLLDPESDLEVVASARSATEAMEKLADSLPALAIIDLSLRDADGTYLIQQISAKHPTLRILVYSMSDERLYAGRVAKAGAHGYVMKTATSADLRNGIRRVLSGKLYFSSDILSRLKTEKTKNNTQSFSSLENLSNREMDVFNLLGNSLDSIAIGEKLGISPNTVDTHRINIKNKLCLPNGRALIEYAHDVVVHGRGLKKRKRQTGR